MLKMTATVNQNTQGSDPSNWVAPADSRYNIRGLCPEEHGPIS